MGAGRACGCKNPKCGFHDNEKSAPFNETVNPGLCLMHRAFRSLISKGHTHFIKYFSLNAMSDIALMETLLDELRSIANADGFDLRGYIKAAYVIEYFS